MQKRTPWQINRSQSDNWQTQQLAKQQNAAGTAVQKVTPVSAPAASSVASSPNGDVVFTSTGNTLQAFHGVPFVGTLAAGQGYYLSGGQLVPVTLTFGTVTSVGVTVPSFMSVSSSPITVSGTFAFSFNAQSAKTFLGGPASGSAAAPSFVSVYLGNSTNATSLSDVTITSLATGQVLQWNGSGWVNATPSTGFTNPMTTAGDLLYENATPAPARLGIGTSGEVLTVVGGLPAWAAGSGGGGSITVTGTPRH